MTETHIALYRKYRPNTFEDVVGQEHIVTLLTSTIAQKKTSHAYLFCGGRGTGKTTVARIFARDIGCNPEDIIEIDAASNRGIDEIRELREAVRTAPFSSPYKVYIIDEAHMLTKDAANALLKTLEEPPSHVVFILATTDPDKLPQTIVSRCQKIIFKQPDIATLAKRLLHVAKKENKKMSEDSAIVIARHGKGSYRDALGVLEQICAVSKEDIIHEEVISLLGTPTKELILKLLEALCTKNTQEITEVISLLRTSSALDTYDECIEYIRQGLLIRVGKNTEEKGELFRLATEYPHTIGSKTILTLLEKRYLIEVSHTHAWTAFLAIFVDFLEE
ncbi:MAG: DNA polymerase III subunit gamma/tau [Candidatus Pacebacteria bacterium]|nr:DNA polymerase III subunit gamma/tau [Candidatus Paceibacterota bacterium]MBP9866581.1 DNA polymerase III subunit gamma/tau [Candidatus Paceibacterota bacterium]